MVTLVLRRVLSNFLRPRRIGTELSDVSEWLSSAPGNGRTAQPPGPTTARMAVGIRCPEAPPVDVKTLGEISHLLHHRVASVERWPSIRNRITGGTVLYRVGSRQSSSLIPFTLRMISSAVSERLWAPPLPLRRRLSQLHLRRRAQCST